MEKVSKKFKNLELGFLSFPRAKALPWRGGGGEGYQRNFWVGMRCWEPIMRSRVASFSGLSLRGRGRGFPRLLSSGNRKEIEPKGIPSCFIPSLLFVLFTLATWNLSDISDFATLYLTKLPKSLPTSFPNLQSSSTSKGAFWRFPDFKRGKKIAFPPPSPPCNVVPLFKLSSENNKHSNFEWRGQGRNVNFFVLSSYPIWGQCLNDNILAAIVDKNLQPNDQFPGKGYPILDSNSLISIPYPRPNCFKTLSFTEAHTCLVHIWQ